VARAAAFSTTHTNTRASEVVTDTHIGHERREREAIARLEAQFQSPANCCSSTKSEEVGEGFGGIQLHPFGKTLRSWWPCICSSTATGQMCRWRARGGGGVALVWLVATQLVLGVAIELPPEFSRDFRPHHLVSLETMGRGLVDDLWTKDATLWERAHEHQRVSRAMARRAELVMCHAWAGLETNVVS
jgi:hypothetical protein